MPATHPERVHKQTLNSIRDVAAEQWDALFDEGYPFCHHNFLRALEDSGSVHPDKGWEPAHQILREDDGRLIAAAPCYRKQHSYGEFVFDFEWAHAAAQIGQNYYPKGLCAVPFAPVVGPRIGARDTTARQAMAQQLRGFAASEGLSSMHLLFAEAEDAGALTQAGFVERQDLQFRFVNRGYADFDAYLNALSSARRKKIRRERRRVQEEAGIGFEVMPGDAMDEAMWRHLYGLYANTYNERGQTPYLSEAFWLDYGMAPGTPVRAILAREQGHIVACALCLQGGDTLYGRHWGSVSNAHSLHFETCYYQGIDYVLRQGLDHFDAGAQGGHKLLRGFDPVVTRSLHWLAEPRLHAAVATFVAREREAVAAGQEALSEHSAYRQTDATASRGSAR